LPEIGFGSEIGLGFGFGFGSALGLWSCVGHLPEIENENEI
jgi:hypothetical protein